LQYHRICHSEDGEESLFYNYFRFFTLFRMLIPLKYSINSLFGRALLMLFYFRRFLCLRRAIRVVDCIGLINKTGSLRSLRVSCG